MRVIPASINIPLPCGAHFKESFVFFVCTKSHYPLHTRPIVPTAVENDDFTRRRQLFEIALKVNLRALPLGRSWEGNYPKYVYFGDRTLVQDSVTLHSALGSPPKSTSN